MELRHLVYFRAVAEEENFHRAAQRLHISQSPLSRQIRDLQAEIGVELFEHVGRGVRLTPAGRVFATKVESILASVESAVDEARLVGDGMIGTLHIGFETGTAYFGALGPIVAEFRRKHPLITVSLSPMSSAEQWAALHSGEIALGYGNYLPTDRSLHHLVVSRDRLGLVLPHDHHLAKKPDLEIQDLAGSPILMQPRSLYPRLHDDIIAALHSQDVDLEIAAEIIDLEALLTLVVAGDALTFLPGKQARVLLLGEAVWRPISNLVVDVHEIAMWRPRDSDSPLLRPLIDVVKARTAPQ